MVDCTHNVPSYRAEYNDKLDTITNALHDEGYKVSYYGKWHIERTHKLEKFGISSYETELHLPSFNVTLKDKHVLAVPGYPEKVVCGVFSEDSTSTEEHYLYEKTIADIKSQKHSGNPFCVFISTYAPHDPYCVPQEVHSLYEGKELQFSPSWKDPMDDKPAIYRRMRAALGNVTDEDYAKVKRCYYSYCTLVDQQIGKLVQYLKDNNLYDNTMIVCLSDHGDMMGGHGMMMKGMTPFEEVYHIPLVIKLPNQERAGQVADFYINMYEIAPTVLELAGCRPLQGENIGPSMVPWIKGEKTDKHYAFAEFYGQRYEFTQRIFWEDNMKYIFNAFDYDELYDLQADPNELTNLSEHPGYSHKKQRLCERMWECIKDSDDATLMNAVYFPLRIAPTGPGVSSSKQYSTYNKTF